MSDWQRFADAANASPEEIEEIKMNARRLTETVVLQTFSLQIIGPNDGRELAALHGTLKVREIMREAEENLSDLLPPNYSVSIQEWDAEEEHPQ